MYFSKGDEAVQAQAVKDIHSGIEIFEKELSGRNTKFFGGSKPGM